MSDEVILSMDTLIGITQKGWQAYDDEIQRMNMLDIALAQYAATVLGIY